MGEKVRADERTGPGPYERAAWEIAPLRGAYVDFPERPMFREEWRDVRAFRWWEAIL
jgi:hypothetical protein